MISQHSNCDLWSWKSEFVSWFMWRFESWSASDVLQWVFTYERRNWTTVYNYITYITIVITNSCMDCIIYSVYNRNFSSHINISIKMPSKMPTILLIKYVKICNFNWHFTIFIWSNMFTLHIYGNPILIFHTWLFVNLNLFQLHFYWFDLLFFKQSLINYLKDKFCNKLVVFFCLN